MPLVFNYIPLGAPLIHSRLGYVEAVDTENVLLELYIPIREIWGNKGRTPAYDPR